MSGPGTEAEILLDQCDFAGAREALRQSVLLSRPSFQDLGSLAIAEDGERLDFRRALVRAYPDSIDVLLDDIARLKDSHHHGVAVERCGELLRRPGWTPRETLLIRSIRLNAAILSKSCSTFKEDIIYIISIYNDLEEAIHRLVHKDVARAITRIDHPAFLSPLAEIRGETGGDHSLSELIDHKIAQLRIIQQF